MPVTPVGQLPYPLGTDPPSISQDIKALAMAVDGWVAGLDTALQTRLGAVSTRLTNLTTRLGTTTTALNTANSNMTAGDAAITSAQNAITSVENRLGTQDTTYSSLQTRYNADNTALTGFVWNTPRGLLTSAGPSGTHSDSSSSPFVLQWAYIPYDGTRAWLRVFYNLWVSCYLGYPVEFRICWASGNTPPVWSQYLTQTLYTNSSQPYNEPFSMLATAQNGPGGLSIGVLVQGGGTAYSCALTGSHVQHMTGSV